METRNRAFEYDTARFALWCDPEDVTPYERNAKMHDERQVNNIANSIRRFGWQQDCVVTRDRVLVIGHGRRMAAIQIGCRMPYHVIDKDADQLTDEDIRELRIADNRINAMTGFDEYALETDSKGLTFEGFDWDTLDETPEAENEVTEDGYEPEPPSVPKAKRGNIWRLGEHRLMCGDSSSKEDIEKLFEGGQPVFVFTDPPYGVAIGDKNAALKKAGNKSKSITENIIGDTLGTNELRALLTRCMANLRTHCDEGCSYYVSAPQGGELGMMMMMMMADAGLTVRHNLVWVKNAATFSMRRLDYDYQHEPIFYTWTKHHKFYGDYGTTVIDDREPIDKMDKAELRELCKALMQARETSVLDCEKPHKSELHPTMKPVKLVGRLMINSSRKGDLVADIFGGSGTTMIAAEQLGRRCMMMELDEKYCDVIIDRWEKLTGRKAELING